jgi:hypothetical protein
MFLESRFSLPALGPTESISTDRWIAVVVTIGYMALMGWQLRSALRGGPDWRSGGPGPLRLTRSQMIAVAIIALVLAPVFLASTWLI